MSGFRAHFELLDVGGEIVTATRRQAQELARAYTLRQCEAGRAVWRTPRIQPWATWADRSWRTLARESRSGAVLLDSFAAGRAWERIVAESPTGQTLLDPRAAGRAAANAWALAHEWRLDLADLAPGTHEQSAFLGWARTWMDRCTEHAWLDPARLYAELAAEAPRLARSDEAATFDGPLGFHGFEAVAPARRELMEAVKRAGRRTVELAVDQPCRRLHTLATGSPELELEAIAAWIVARLRENPAARLAVIVPDLAGRWATVRRVMDDRLQPALLAPGAEDDRPYALAAGPRLRDYAVVDAALLLLGFARERVDLAVAGRVLRSPYLRGAATEASRRARLDAYLRRVGEPQVRTEWLRTLAAGESFGCPELAASLQRVRDLLPRDVRRSAAQWATAMERALLEAGWPEGRTLASTEYQTARKFHEVLSAMGALERVLPPITLAEALEELRAAAAEMAFQPEAGDPSVVFLESLVEPGLALDGLWIAGLTADRFPVAAAPDPFLPVHVQRDFRLPHASAEQELDGARRSLAGWLRSATEVVLSWPERDADGDRLPSALLPRGTPLELPPHVTPRTVAVRAAARLEPWTDTPLPRLPDGEPLLGGVSVLELQSLCPFRAGAEQRLGAKPLERPRLGLDPRERGQLAHAAQAALWRDVRSHAALVALGPEGRERAVRTAIEEAFAALGDDRRRTRLHALERAWLQRAMLALLEIELARAPFVVIEREAERTLRLGERRLEVRVDRLDRLEDGTTVLIDYKTGRADPMRWTGDRPDQPQLPAYAAHLPETPVVVAFARVACAEPGFSGLAAKPALVPGTRTTAEFRHDALRDRPWDNLIDEWRRVTVGLAEAYAAGHADVDPAEGACRYCSLGGFCRVENRVTEAEGEVEAEGGEGARGQ
ncbi:MAG: PD-(D/E)XK nuclease family protein [Steroidobacteraceae bacterium]|nr:PD-(D/E)XK nuclease family protein [Steroidobacteraceae bacterium]